MASSNRQVCQFPVQKVPTLRACYYETFKREFNAMHRMPHTIHFPRLPPSAAPEGTY